MNQVVDDLQTIQGHVATLQAIQETLEPMRGSCTVREQQFKILRDQLRSSDDLVQRQMGTVMASFQVGSVLKTFSHHSVVSRVMPMSLLIVRTFLISTPVLRLAWSTKYKNSQTEVFIFR